MWGSQFHKAVFVHDISLSASAVWVTLGGVLCGRCRSWGQLLRCHSLITCVHRLRSLWLQSRHSSLQKEHRTFSFGGKAFKAVLKNRDIKFSSVSHTCPGAGVLVFLVVIAAINVSLLVINTFFFFSHPTLIQDFHPNWFYAKRTKVFVQKKYVYIM